MSSLGIGSSPFDSFAVPTVVAPGGVGASGRRGSAAKN